MSSSNYRTRVVRIILKFIASLFGVRGSSYFMIHVTLQSNGVRVTEQFVISIVSSCVSGCLWLYLKT